MASHSFRMAAYFSLAVLSFAPQAAKADEVVFGGVVPAPTGQGYEAIFKHGKNERGAVVFYQCEALVNQTNVQIYGALMRSFKDMGNDLQSTMPQAVRDAIEACKANGVQPHENAPSSYLSPRTLRVSN